MIPSCLRPFAYVLKRDPETRSERAHLAAPEFTDTRKEKHKTCLGSLEKTSLLRYGRRYHKSASCSLQKARTCILHLPAKVKVINFVSTMKRALYAPQAEDTRTQTRIRRHESQHSRP